VGTQGTVAGDYGHQITNNTIRNCLTEGIMIKCGDTLVSGNTLVNCPGTALSVVAGSDSVIESNRIVDAGTGIRVTGNGHTITNNCIVRCRENALQVFFESETEIPLQGALFIENNTCVDWGIGDGSAVFGGIRIVSVITCIVRNNILYGAGNPVVFAKGFSGKNTHFVDDNIVAGGCGVVQGFRSEEVVFASAATDDYTSQLRYGAQGWVLSPDNAGRDMRSTFAAALPDLEDDDRHEESDTDFVNTGDAPDVFNALYSWFDNPESDNDFGNRTVDNGTMSADDESEYVD
jgi:hypothetical protein